MLLYVASQCSSSTSCCFYDFHLRRVLLRSVLSDVPPDIVVTTSISRAPSFNILRPLTCSALVEIAGLGGLASSLLDIAALLGWDSATGSIGAVLYCQVSTWKRVGMPEMELTSCAAGELVCYSLVDARLVGLNYGQRSRLADVVTVWGLTGCAATADGLAAEAGAILIAKLVTVVVQVLFSFGGDVLEVTAFVFLRHDCGLKEKFLVVSKVSF